MLQANSPPAKESQLSSSSSHIHPAPGRRPAGYNRENTSSNWEADPRGHPSRWNRKTRGVFQTRGRPQGPVVRAPRGTLTKPKLRDQNPCHPTIGREHLSQRTKAQVGGPAATLGSYWLGSRCFPCKIPENGSRG